jgi:LacI family transcriptional regulator
MNGQTNVREATRKRILAAVRALHYVPHSGARSLITRHTNAVGVLLPDLYGEFFSELIRGIDTVARPRGLQLLLSSVHGGAPELAAAIRAMRGRVDGLLLMSPHVDAALLDQNLPSGLPIVLLNSPLAGSRLPSVNVDGYQGARAIVRHLASLGRRYIAHVAGPPNHLDSGERLRGYVDEMAKVAPDGPTLVMRGDFGIESGYAAGRRIAARTERPDAVFAANDAMAVGCLSAFEDLGLRVPEDIAVVGFDDIPLAALVRPALTTAAVHIAELGSRALEMLILDMEGAGRGKARSRSFVPEVVVRASCGGKREQPPRRPGRPAVGGV